MEGVAIRTFTDRDGVKHPITGGEGGGGIDTSILEMLNEKIDKVSNDMTGHLAQFNAEGGLEDGGAKGQFASADHTHSQYSTINHTHNISDINGFESRLAGKMDALRTLRITQDIDSLQYPIAAPDLNVLLAFINDAPNDMFVPVRVELYGGGIKECDVFGMAKVVDGEGEINVDVVIGRYKFSAYSQYQDERDYQFIRWEKTVLGRGLFD